MNQAIKIVGTITERKFEHQILPQFDRVRRIIRPEQIVVVDLSKFGFSGPSFPAVLLTMIGHLSEDLAARVLLIPPESKRAAAYLNRIAFFDYAGFIADFDTMFLSDINKYARSKHSLTILEINKISEESNTSSIINHLLIDGHDIIATNLHYSHEKVKTFLKIIAELCLNITDHSESWGVVLIQYLSYLAKPVVRISVADKGIGVKQSLIEKHSKEYESASDCECIKAILREGMTRRKGRLLGLHAIRGFVKGWHGVIRMRSGTGKVLITQIDKEKQVSGLVFFPGTYVDIELPPHGEAK